MTAEAAHEMYAALDVTGLSALEVAVLALFVALFGWIAFSFTSVVGGCLSLLSGVGRLDDDGEQGPPRKEQRAQGRKYRRVGKTLWRSLSADDGARRR